MIPVLSCGSWNSTQPSAFVGMSAFSAARMPCSCFLISGAAIVSRAREGPPRLRNLCGSPPFLLASNKSDRAVDGDMNCPGTTSLVGVSVPGVVVPDVTLPGNSLPGVVVPDAALPGNSLPGDDLSDIALPRNSLPGVVVPDAALPGVAPLRVAKSLVFFPSDLLVGSPPTVVSRAFRTDSMDPERVRVAAWLTIEHRASCTASMVARVTVEALPPHDRLFMASQLLRPVEECRVAHTGLQNPENLVVGVWPT